MDYQQEKQINIRKNGLKLIFFPKSIKFFYIFKANFCSKLVFFVILEFLAMLFLIVYWL